MKIATEEPSRMIRLDVIDYRHALISMCPESLIYVLVIRRFEGAWPSQDKAAAS
jgi:hypothetical protein